MDYEKLVQQRRRNWEALKPDDVRRREKEEELERRREEAEKTGKGFKQDRMDKQRTEQAEREAAQFRRAVRQCAVLGGAFLLAVMVLIGLNEFRKYTIRAGWLARIDESNRVIESGGRVDDLSDPIGALATWRSAWAAGDVEKVARLYSRRYINILSRKNDLSAVIKEHKRLWANGNLQSEADIAALFANAEILNLPTPPWSHEQLASFRSDWVQYVGEAPPGRRFVASFSWDNDIKKWRFSDVREEQFFSVKWRNEPAIQVAKGGPRAFRYDEQGDRLP